MKLLNIVILSTYAIAAFAGPFDGTGPHKDGRFLASAIAGGKACTNDNEFNLLEPDLNDATIPKLYDATTEAITNCVACTPGAFTTIYGAQASGFALADLNRPECCYNDKLAVCQEMMRAYQEGCNSGGDAGKNRPLDDAGAQSTCPT
jgi:hypothetical protein